MNCQLLHEAVHSRLLGQAQPIRDDLVRTFNRLTGVFVDAESGFRSDFGALRS